MNKKITIFAVVLIVVGIIGSISSSIAAVPFATRFIKECEKKASKEVVLYEKNFDIKQLDIDTKDLNVEIRKSNSDKVKIVKLGATNSDLIKVEENKNLIKILQNRQNKNINIEIQGFGDAIINMMNLGKNKLIIYVPNSVNIQANCRYGDLDISDSEVLNKKLNFETEYRQLSLPKKIKNLDTLNICSNGDVNLKTSEFLGIKNINISTTGGVYLNSEPNEIFIEDVEKFIPENFNITSSSYSIDVNISSSIPVAKNLNIDNKLGSTYLNLPTQRYNILFDLDASDNIYFNNNSDNEHNEGNSEQSSTQNSFKGTLKENDGKMYKVKVNSQDINLNN